MHVEEALDHGTPPFLQGDPPLSEGSAFGACLLTQYAHDIYGIVEPSTVQGNAVAHTQKMTSRIPSQARSVFKGNLRGQKERRGAVVIKEEGETDDSLFSGQINVAIRSCVFPPPSPGNGPGPSSTNAADKERATAA